MSQGTIETARYVMAALSRGDLDALLAVTDPEVEWFSFFAELGERGVYRGHQGLSDCMSDLADAWEIVRADIDDVIAVGDVALLVGRIHYRGSGSGIEHETPAGWMLRFRNEKVIRFRAFREPEQALGSIGGDAG